MKSSNELKKEIFILNKLMSKWNDYPLLMVILRMRFDKLVLLYAKKKQYEYNNKIK